MKYEDIISKLYVLGFNLITVDATTKHPYIPINNKKPTEWKSYQEKRLTKDELLTSIKNITNEGKQYKIGIIPDKIQDGIYKGMRTFGIDFDDPQNIELLNITPEKCQKNGAWFEKTRRGYHIYGVTKTYKESVKHNDIGIEFFGTTGQIIVHGNFPDDTDFNTLKPMDVEEVFNGWSNILYDKKGIKKTTDVKNFVKGVKLGDRNNSAFRLACEHRDMGWDVGTCTRTLLEWNKKNNPPLHENEVLTCIRSAYKKQKEQTDIGGLLAKYNIFIYNKDGRIIGINHYNLAELIRNEYSYNFITIHDASKDIYYYEEGYYHKNAENIIRNLVQELIGDFTRINVKHEVVDVIRDTKYIQREKFDAPVNLICLKNGIYDIRKKELIEHSPSFYFLGKLPINYNPGAKNPFWENFIKNICMQQGKRRIDVEETIQEYAGYCLYRAYPFKRFVIIDGCGNQGRTQLFQGLLKVIGEENNTSVPLQDLNDKHFAKCKLYGKLTNISDDLPKKVLKYTGVIKEITGGSPIWADIKNHRDGIEFTNYAKPWYACNEMPITYDTTDAFFTRVIQITFLNKYVTNEEEIDNITTFEAVPDIHEMLTDTEEKKSGILNWMIEGLHRLLEQQGFSLKQTIADKRDLWMEKSNPVYALLKNNYEIGNSDWCITKSDFESDVNRFCADKGYSTLSSNAITRMLNDLHYQIYLGQRTIDGEPRVRVWIGLRNIVDITINHYISENKPKNEQNILTGLDGREIF